MTTLEETQKGHRKKVPFACSITYKNEQFMIDTNLPISRLQNNLLLIYFEKRFQWLQQKLSQSKEPRTGQLNYLNFVRTRLEIPWLWKRRVTFSLTCVSSIYPVLDRKSISPNYARRNIQILQRRFWLLNSAYPSSGQSWSPSCQALPWSHRNGALTASHSLSRMVTSEECLRHHGAGE